MSVLSIKAIKYYQQSFLAGEVPTHFICKVFILTSEGETMKHLFDVDIAVKYGVNAAVLLENIGYWIKQNEANETNYFDGNYWTYNSRRAYKELFPYMSERQIYNALEKLINDGLLVTGNYNKLAYDRTLWYALTQKGKCILHFDTMDYTKMSNGNSENVTPIPDINTNNKPTINTNNNKRFQPPTIEEVKAYCFERKNNVDPERFINYYTSNGWQVGKHKMKDWKAAVRTWEKNNFNSAHTKKGANGIAIDNRQTDDLDGIM